MPVSAAKPAPRILEESNEHPGDGTYRFRFVSEDEISREEEGAAGAASGSFSYTSPEGAAVQVSYVADALGFRPQGAALPTPVPTQYPTPSVPLTEPPAARS
ncbi:endocuticle structural glycoprotein SgAbd-8-like [Pollicipes pollicipes]|uniref:endocuticle structural glycoprotein SgAbd-8-like n=1 Tax=Pollicipes pollicipes TaxID=41117 RepID=UPI001885853E|nr:endocuticle structural glycoprotein SgAbd-8-like [Pollicipes pollicipes]